MGQGDPKVEEMYAWTEVSKITPLSLLSVQAKGNFKLFSVPFISTCSCATHAVMLHDHSMTNEGEAEHLVVVLAMEHDFKAHLRL